MTDVVAKDTEVAMTTKSMMSLPDKVINSTSVVNNGSNHEDYRKSENVIKDEDLERPDTENTINETGDTTAAVKGVSILHGPTQNFNTKDLNSIWKKLLQIPGMSEQTAVIAGEESLTFAEVDRKSDLLACHLQQVIGKPRSNVHLGQRIAALFIPENECRLITILALIKLEVIYIPLDVVLPKDRMRHIIKDSGASVLLYQGDDYLRYVKDLSDLIILIDIDIILDAAIIDENESDLKIIEAESINKAVVCILYTSGSTGKPKGVPIRHCNIINRLKWQWKAMPWSKNDTGCHKTSLLFVDSLTEILSCLLAGKTIVIIPRHVVKEPDMFVDMLHHRKVTRVVVVPSLLQNMITYGDAEKLQTIRVLICSGEALSLNLALIFIEKCPKTTLVNLYGSTETTGDILCMMYTEIDDIINNCQHGYLAIGKPIENNDVYILDNDFKAVEEGKVGELFLAGANVVDNYVTHDEDHFIANTVNPELGIMYRPGDYGVLRNGYVIYQGRQDSQVKIRGHRVNLREIEQVLEEIPSIDDVTALTCPCRSGSVIVAFYTTNTRRHPQRKTLLQTLKQRLPSYMLPVLVRLEAIPLQCQTGKVDRMALKRLYTELCEVSLHDLDNDLQSDPYRLLLHVVAKELGVPESLLEPNACFSDVGGNSLAAIATVIQLNQLGFNITIKDLISATSLNELAENAEKQQIVVTHNKSDELKLQHDVILMKPQDMAGYELFDLDEVTHKEEVTDLLARGFTEKNPLDMLAGTTYESFGKLVSSIWKEIVTDKLSFVVIKTIEGDGMKKNAIVGATLSLDIRTSIEPHFDKMEVADINDAVESPVKERLLESGEKWMDCLLNAVEPSLSDDTALGILHMMEERLLSVAKQRGYHGIVTVNSHPVTMAVAENFFGYTAENTVHVRSFKWNGIFPFKMAADDYVIKAMTKRILPKVAGNKNN